MADPTQVSPNIYKTIFENDRARVLVAKRQPGERDEMHEHPHLIFYTLSDIKKRAYSPDGSAKVFEAKGRYGPGLRTDRGAFS